MNNDRDIESEMEAEMQARRKQDGDWSPWGPLDWPDDYGDYEYYADRLKRKGQYASLGNLGNVRKKAIEFKNETNLIDNITDFETYEAEKFIEWLETECDITDNTVDKYLSRISSMAAFYAEANYYDGNPFAHIDKTSNRAKNSNLLENNRVEISTQELRSAIAEFGVKNLNTVLITMLAKSGARVSEICNVDDPDVHIDHPVWEDITVRNEIKDRPDTIWIDSNKQREAYIDETNGNKRKVDTPIPIDNELKQILVWWVAVRPKSTSSERPFLRSNLRRIGQRINTNQAYWLVKNWSKQNGFWSEESDEMYNVTPHWFRSFFTTTMQNNISKDDIESLPVNIEKFVKGLRGDVGGDVIDRYTQVYDSYRDIVTENQPKFGIQ